MKPEDLVIGRTYQYTSQYIDEMTDATKIFIFLGRRQLCNMSFVYLGLNDDETKYKFNLVTVLTGNMTFTESQLEHLQEKPID